jgi:hypothetical protein
MIHLKIINSILFLRETLVDGNLIIINKVCAFFFKSK